MQARPKNIVTFKQIPFDVNWLDKYGYMTGALELLEEATKQNIVYIGYQTLEEDTLPLSCRNDTNAMVTKAVKTIVEHTVDSHWSHPLQFRIGQGEIIQELVYQDRWHTGKEKFHPTNASARIREEMLSIYAVDRDWKRIDSDIAELKRIYPYRLFTNQPHGNLPELAWIDSMSFPAYCPLYFPRWYDHIKFRIDQLWSVLAQNEKGSGRMVPASITRGISNISPPYRSDLRDAKLHVTTAQEELLWDFQELSRSVAYDRVVEGVHVDGLHVTAFYTTDEENERIIPAMLSLLQRAHALIHFL